MSIEEVVTRPRPRVDRDSAPFWEGLREHKLLLQRCRDCQTLRWPARSLCNRCYSTETDWVPSSGRGQIASWIISYRAVHPAFTDQLPYNVVLVKLDEQADIQMIGNLMDCPNEAIAAGMPVEVVFEDVAPDYTVALWRPVRA